MNLNNVIMPPEQHQILTMHLAKEQLILGQFNVGSKVSNREMKALKMTFEVNRQQRLIIKI